MRPQFKITIALAALFAAAQLLGQTSRTADVQFKAAQHKEEVEGDLKGAIEDYKKIAQGKDRSLSATALLQMASCYEKLGDSEAQSIYARIAREFADQPDAVSQARRRLGTLSGAASSNKLTARQVMSGSPSVNGAFDITPDGRLMVQTDWEKTGDLVIRNLQTGEIHRLMAKTASLQESSEFAENPIFSPDERELAFAWFDGNTYQLRIMPNQPGAKPRILVNNHEFTYVAPAGWSRDRASILVTFWKSDNTSQFVWVAVKDGAMRTLKSLDWRQPSLRADLSPDGRYVAYSAREQFDADKRDIYLLAADGSHETVLVSGSSATEDPVWTPDGRHILFTSDRAGSFGLWAISVRDGKAAGDPFLVKPDIGRTYRIGVTRDGSYYYMSRRGGEDVFVADMAPDGGQVHGASTRLTEKFVGSNRSPSWSPNGKSIAFKRSGPVEYYDLVVRSLETGAEKTYAIKWRTWQVPRPLWFPDSKSILLDVVDNQGRNGYYRLDLETGNFVEIVPPSKELMQWASLSPDGRTVYVVKWPRGDAGNSRSIVAFDIATKSEKLLFTDPEGSLTTLAVSPDGRTLAMTRSIRRGQRVIAVIDVDESNYRPLPTAEANPVNVGMLAWTKDGRAILYGSADDTPQVRLMRMAIEGRKPDFTGLTIAKGATSGSAITHALDLNPDGTRIVFGDGVGPIKEVWVLENVLSALKSAR